MITKGAYLFSSVGMHFSVIYLSSIMNMIFCPLKENVYFLKWVIWNCQGRQVKPDPPLWGIHFSPWVLNTPFQNREDCSPLKQLSVGVLHGRSVSLARWEQVTSLCCGGSQVRPLDRCSLFLWLTTEDQIPTSKSGEWYRLLLHEEL